ncbi:MAG: PASTA domain-containing protein [Chloroherpetonaceae bacterium]|nr:PASTA domain-containing protein [Chloroherpetonaceae bacterium]
MFERFKASLTSSFAKKVYVTFFAILAIAIVFDKVMMPLVTKGGRITIVPDVSGKTMTQATLILESEGLKVKEGYQRFDPKKPLGVVLSQIPSSGSEVKAGRHIYLSLNVKRKQNAPLPDLAGRTLADAKLTIERYGLSLGDVQFAIASTKSQEGLVMAQSIPKGTMITEGTKIDLTIGKSASDLGLLQASVPEVTGKTSGEAEAILTDAGFAAPEIKYQYSTNLIPNTVIGQEPMAGVMWELATPVKLIVATQNRDLISPE